MTRQNQTGRCDRGQRQCGTAVRGFTLIEILIVVVILGILAAMVVPQFSNATQSARQGMLKDEVRYLRTQIIVYKAQHRDVAPGYTGGTSAGLPTEVDFIAQMTQYTDDLGNVSPVSTPVFRYGPYLQKVPDNPLNGFHTLTIVANGNALPDPGGTTGWIYKAETQELIPDLQGADDGGVLYKNY